MIECLNCRRRPVRDHREIRCPAHGTLAPLAEVYPEDLIGVVFKARRQCEACGKGVLSQGHHECLGGALAPNRKPRRPSRSVPMLPEQREIEAVR